MKNRKQASDFSPLNMGVLDSFLDADDQQIDASNESEVKWISLRQLHPAKWQPRRYFDPHKISELAASFAEHGFKGTVNVRPLGQDQYEIIAGERRYRAAKEAVLKEIPCVVADYTDEQALEFSLIENLIREDLSKLEETEGILDFIALKLKMKRDEVIATIRTEGHSDRLSRNNVIPSNTIGKIGSILEQFGIGIAAFRSNNLLLLKLPEELREAHLTGKLSYTKAIELNRIKDDAVRAKLLQQTIENDWSISEVRQEVKLARSNVTEKSGAMTKDVLDRMTTARKRIQKPDFWQDQSKVMRLERLLSEIEALFD